MDSNIFDRLISNSRNNVYPQICKDIVERISHEGSMPATHIIEKTFDLLLEYSCNSSQCVGAHYSSDHEELYAEALNLPGFNSEPGSAALMSEGMLVQECCSDVICDILKPNLYCVLLMERIGKAVPGPISLNRLKDKYYQSLDDTQRVKSLPKLFNDEWKSLFVIEQKNKGAPYQIGTPYLELLSAMIQNYRISPLSKTKSRYSFQYNKEFYEACVNSIDKNTQTDPHMRIAQHYLLERIFRFNTKHTLFGRYSSEGHCSKGESISPGLFADFFLSSPLVFFPKRMLASLFCESYEKQVQILHLFIQLSSICFWLVLGILRDYIHIQNITLENLDKFFFSPEEFSTFQKECILTRINWSEPKMSRKKIECYTSEWCTFTPPSEHYMKMLFPKAIDEWQEKDCPTTYSVDDCNALRAIQDTLK